MGSDDLHRKRKERSLASFKREIGKRAQYARCLIICEDSKTSPSYFKEMCSHFGLHPANIEIKGCSFGTDAMSIIEEALEKYNLCEDYDDIFCVFDKEHTNYQQALGLIEKLRADGIPIHAIPSVPCIEYWFKLHFEDTDRPYVQAGKKSPAEQLKSEMREHMGDYHPSNKHMFSKTKQYLPLAIERAKRINKRQKKNGTDNPSTKVYELVEYLISMRESTLNRP